MIPRQYYFEDREELSQFIEHSVINERLYEGYLIIRNQYQDGHILPHPVTLFNDAFYYANKVCFDEYPEMDFGPDYFVELKEKYHDQLTKDVFLTFVYAILSNMQDQPKKVQRFTHLMSERVNFIQGYLDELWNFNKLPRDFETHRDRYYNDFTPSTPFLDTPFPDYASVNWYEATDRFKWYNIKTYISRGYDLAEKFQMLEAIKTDYHKISELFGDAPDKLDIDFERTLNMLEYEKEKLKENSPEDFYKIFPKEKNDSEKIDMVISDTSVESSNSSAVEPCKIKHVGLFDYGNQEVLPEGAAYSEAINNYISTIEFELATAQQAIESMNDKIVELQKINDELLMPSDDEIKSCRTRSSVSGILYEILKRALPQNGKQDLEYSKAAEIICYLTGFSKNTIRQGLSKETRTEYNKDEIDKILKLLEEVKIHITLT